MLRKLAVLALAFGLAGCGSGDKEKRILLDYINKMQQLEGKNRQIVKTIEHLREPISEISEQDLAEARQLINDYVAQLKGLVLVDLEYRELRVTHNRYVTEIEQAIKLSVDKGREIRREKSSVGIGVRHIEKLTKLHYNGIDILWLRQKIADPYPLQWPQ